MKKKIFISGCGGMLGEAFYYRFRDDYDLRCTDIDVNERWLSHCDIRDVFEYIAEVTEFDPDYLFHLGALTDLEYCELNEKEAEVVNTFSVGNAIALVNKLDIPLLYIGTAGIFDGKKDSYDENDEPNPLCIYAKTKHEGEKFVLKEAKKPIVCRASWMVGGEKKDKNFVQALVKQIRAGKKTLYVVNDKRGTMTYTHDFAKNVKLLINGGHTGLFNMANLGNTSRLEIANEILTTLGLHERVDIVGVPSSHFRKDYHAVRPDCECLVNKRLNELGLNIMRDWRVALREYLEDY